MTVEGQEDLEGLLRVGRAVRDARETMAKKLEPGMTTADLDAIGREVLDRHGARSAPNLAYDFPGTTCISVNDAIAHGIPSKTCVLREGDLVNIDVSAEIDGYWADTGASFSVGPATGERKLLLSATERALADAMKEARADRPVRNIGRAVERRARRHGFRVVRTLAGHGVGRRIHEPPSIPNTFDPRDRTMLREGLVITIEPFLTNGARTVVEDDDGWTLRTPDGSIGAQFEHTMVITRGQPLIVT
jgi:methionyl aminopeptidase